MAMAVLASASLTLHVASAAEEREPATKLRETISVGEVDMLFRNATLAEDAERMGAFLVDDVIYQPPDQPDVVGKEAVVAWVKRDLPNVEKGGCGTTNKLIIDTELAYRHYDLLQWQGPGPTVYSKGVVVYRKGADGRWRIALKSWNYAPAPPVPDSCIPRTGPLIIIERIDKPSSRTKRKRQ